MPLAFPPLEEFPTSPEFLHVPTFEPGDLKKIRLWYGHDLPTWARVLETTLPIIENYENGYRKPSGVHALAYAFLYEARWRSWPSTNVDVEPTGIICQSEAVATEITETTDGEET